MTLGWIPDRIIASDAQRTRSTAELVCTALSSTPEVTFERRLYLGRPEDVRAAIRDVADDVQTLLLLGHNPGWEDALTDLAGVDHTLKTADAALLEAEAERWADLVEDGASFELIRLVRAREVDQGVEPPASDP